MTSVTEGQIVTRDERQTLQAILVSRQQSHKKKKEAFGSDGYKSNCIKPGPFPKKFVDP